MLEIKCPWCGARTQTEFTYAGDATLDRPDAETGSEEDWYEYVYLRDNPRGAHDELWQHSAGCRRYVKVRRDVTTHEIIATGAPGAKLDGGGS
ncbi:MAG: sarcosine oxidase subunit delta [Magnetovibrio sp.]|nr:sarcosine oxidase subunit delta [Magnetovibrio sp.]